ncbi:maleylpyruvate isomerase family mycothiol-dependent enzyme [Nocardioides sp. zg-1228]|uniref:maleylpyruvate isomerase family mycothiol-dependent enzyme n=1 Tax=Nocardioides sp. zg-1228 TaxID=2763008 RepID=UPI0016430A17|nr:maleylpyruvate isomerase family mycothiol-dependent enzyme [Nocardioides sp. zg-1228]MBC2934641.1 maleylpyruvate isomerase family mycothiol-dependent enzyme [Nocardioides sp. zg-1228]QSF59386.1 maleylpyruvate isomerase family mycothiol-dependent enzyme [Nocardioides sp. zg-1228]
MTRDDAWIFAATSENRVRLADLLDALPRSRWSADTLCDGWSVHVVGAHLLQHAYVTFPRFVLAALRRRGDTDATVDHFARQLGRRLGPSEIVGLLRQHASDRVAPPRVGPWGQLAETCVHLRDIARPLGLDADVPGDHWAALLDYYTSPAVAPALVPPGLLDGLSLVPTDLGGSFGDGLPVHGRAEALTMAASGRAVALDDLSGDGLEVLRRRLAPG